MTDDLTQDQPGRWPPSPKGVAVGISVLLGIVGLIALGSIVVSTVDIILLLVGFVLLLGGAEFLVRGASTLARRLGVGPLVVGLTVVAFGTSAPELFIGVASVLKQKSDFNVGNAVGSNIANVGLILGATALVKPFTPSSQALRREVPIMIVATALAVAAFRDGTLARWEGVTGLVLLALYLLRSFRMTRTGVLPPEFADDEPDAPASPPSGLLDWVVPLVLIFSGLLALIGGSHLLIESGSSIARSFGVADIVIGLTIVALGTSLPELATCVVAALKNEPEIVVGNVIGSNLFNLLFVLGFTSTLSPITIPAATNALDVWVMLGFAFAMPLVSVVGARVTRLEGSILLVAYLVYAVVRYAI